MAQVDGPVLGGLRIGSLVRVAGADESEGQAASLGQIVSCTSSPAGYQVALLNGNTDFFDANDVSAASDLQKPGEGGDEDSFDVLLGPATSSDTLAQEITLCLMEKGFCILRTCLRPDFLEGTLATLREMGNDGKLTRLAEEVEEPYLGTHCRGKTVWLDKNHSQLGKDEALASVDANISYLAQVIQPYSINYCSDYIDERTPALLNLTLLDDEEPEYPPAETDDLTLGTFLSMWRRKLVRVLHYMGPSMPEAGLEVKPGDDAPPLPKLQDGVMINCHPNTILLYRPDCYDYSCPTPDEECLILHTTFLAPAPTLVMNKVDGDMAWLEKLGEGPPPPVHANNINVMNVHTRIPTSWDDGWQYFTGLFGGGDGVIKSPISRFDVDVYYHEDEATSQPWQTNVKHFAGIEGVEMFDNKSFEISNMEAASMDPVQRHILETGSVSLAMYGLTKKVCNRKSTHAGIAVGNDKLDWGPMPKEVNLGALGGTATVLSIIANRFSFIFNLKGPSFVADTACSASLTSTHCAKLMLYERTYDPIDFFVSFGAHLLLTGPFNNGAHMFSPDGRCFTFNASANGYLRGEGISCMLLKYAGIDEDKEAILRATMSGQDGRSASLTAPNGPAQEEVITKALAEGRMTPPESTVWENHGTGTSLGDPIEVGAVRKVQVRMKRTEPLMMSSSKTNFGHHEGNAAMAGMIKCVLEVKHSKCCPTLHLRTLNPHLEHTAFDAGFETEPATFAHNQGHAQVSSFGFGGTNGHGVFWGRNHKYTPDQNSTFMKKIKSMPPPEVRPVGPNPDDWDSDYPDFRNAKPGAKFKISLSPDDPADQSIKYELVDEFEEENDDDCYWSVAGNFNDWSDDRMADGLVPGVSTYTAEIPDSGILEWYFLKNGEADEVLCPEVPNCSRKMVPMVGPGDEVKNKWVVYGAAGSEMQIELFFKDGRKSITWLPMK